MQITRSAGILLSCVVAAALASCTLAQPTPKGTDLPPAGKYQFTAYNLAGKKMYTGELWILQWQRREEEWDSKGRRTIKAHLPEKDVNPIAGKGAFQVTFRQGTLSFNMHPEYRDFNTTFGGAWKGGKCKGEWGSATFAGYKKKGTFALVPVKPAKHAPGKG
jgi:hypothetical protein